MCDCHDHPLEHAIWVALETFENAVPPLKAASVFGQLRQDLETWRLGQREQASADGEVWPEPETCGDCGHAPHTGACQEWVANHTFGTGGLDKRCQCAKGWEGNQ